MPGFRGIFLDSMHPLVIKRLDADHNAFKGMSMQYDTTTVGDASKTTAQYVSTNEGAKYFSERQVWMRVVPFAIPQTVYTTDNNMILENPPGGGGWTVPEWRDWVIWGTKAAGIHGDGEREYGVQDYGEHSNTVGGWGSKHGLYRRTSEAWDGAQSDGVLNSPLPGVTGLQVSNKGDLGTIRRASFDIKVHNLADLEAIEMMYMVPGISVLVEWGWYHPKFEGQVEPINVELITENAALASTTLINTEILKKSFGVGAGSEPGDPTSLYNLEEAATANFGPMGPAAGTYDGLLGVVTKFNWSNDGQGGYDCRVDVISPGSLAAGIPAESFVLGGKLTIDERDIPISDVSTIVSSIKQHTRVYEGNATADVVAKNASVQYKKIKISTNNMPGEVKLSDTPEDNNYQPDIPGKKLNTSTYGIKITKKDGQLVYEASDATEDDGEYFIGEYKGGIREKVLPIYGDRSWWNRVVQYVLTGNPTGPGDIPSKTQIMSHPAMFAKPAYKGKHEATIMRQAFSEHPDYKEMRKRVSMFMKPAGANYSNNLAWGAFWFLEEKYGETFRSGRWAVYNNQANVDTQNKRSVGYKDHGTLATDYMYWFDAAKNRYIDETIVPNMWGLGFFTTKYDKYWYPDNVPGLEMSVEWPGQDDVPLGTRKTAKHLNDITNRTTAASAKDKGTADYGWTIDPDSDTVTDDSGIVVFEDGAWGSNKDDPVVIAEQTGATVYKVTRDADGNPTYTEIASVENQNAGDIANMVRQTAAEKTSADKQAQASSTAGEIAKDAEISSNAINFEAVSWGGPFDDEKPVVFGGGKVNKGIYAKVRPAFAPKVYYVEDTKKYQSSELGYQLAYQGTEVLFPVGMIAYSETYLSWRFVEDYLLNELYMPRATQPGVDTNDTDPQITLDTTFLSANRMSDEEKNTLSDECLQALQGLIVKEGKVLAAESRDREVYHSQNIINHITLRSFNPEVCILPGQESIPPLNQEGSPQPSGGGDMLDAMSNIDADVNIKGSTVLNPFAGLDKSGNRDPSIGSLRNIMINSDLIQEAADKAPNIRKFCMSILDKVNKACGEPWKFKMLTNSALGKISIIDENYTPSNTVSDYGLGYTYNDNEQGVYKFTGIGSDNILKDVKVQSKIPSELQTMAYYATMGTGNEKGSSIQMFNMYRGGVVDRLKSISNITILGNGTGSVETRAKVAADLITSYMELLPKTRINQVAGTPGPETPAGEQIARQYVRKFIHGNTVEVGGYRPPMPIDVSLSLHGISGIYMGNAIMIKTMKEGGILPNRYYKNVALQATAVDHTISPEGWTTEISTLMRPLSNVSSEPVKVVVTDPCNQTELPQDRFPKPEDWTGDNGNPDKYELKTVPIGPSSHNPGGKKVRLLKDAANQYTKMLNAMIVALPNVSLPSRVGGFRLYKVQYQIVDVAWWCKTKKFRKAGSNGKTPVARPGTSNHGLGRAIDFSNGVDETYEAQNWIRENGTPYGWTWYGSEGESIGEPWHFKFIPEKVVI